MIRFVRTPWPLRKWYPSLIWSKNSNDTIYLTFDDGPHPEITPWVMDQLEKVNAKATFFCVGEKISKSPEIARNLIDRGHRIGNHTYNHMKGWDTSNDKYIQDVNKANKKIYEIDQQEPKLFRPPYGRLKRKQIQSLNANFEIVMWSHLSWDFISELNCTKILSKLKSAKAGSILVFHDNEKSFGNLQKILPELLIHYTSKGFKFETL